MRMCIRLSPRGETALPLHVAARGPEGAPS